MSEQRERPRFTPEPYLRKGDLVYTLTNKLAPGGRRYTKEQVNYWMATVQHCGPESAAEDERIAVATLFEAAPTLYEAAKDALGSLEDGTREAENLKAALKKAEGREVEQ